MIRFALLLALLALTIYGFVEYGVASAWFTRPSFSVEIILFLAVMHIGLYVLISRQLSVHPMDFVRIYMGVTVIRILFFGLFAFALIWLDPGGGTRNALLFLIAYVLFTALEVGALFVRINARKTTNLGQKGR